MKTFILSAIAASVLFVAGTSARAHHYDGGHGGGYYDGGYGGGYAAPGHYVNVGSYDSYRGYGRHGGYGIRPAGYRTHRYSSAPRYTSRSYRLRTLGPSYVSPPYTLPEHRTRTYSVPSYTYRSPSYYGSSSSYRPSAVASTYTTTYGSGSYGVVPTVPYSQTYTGGYDYRCGC